MFKVQHEKPDMFVLTTQHCYYKCQAIYIKPRIYFSIYGSTITTADTCRHSQDCWSHSTFADEATFLNAIIYPNGIRSNILKVTNAAAHNKFMLPRINIALSMEAAKEGANSLIYKKILWKLAVKKWTFYFPAQLQQHPTRETRRRVQYKWRKICRNSLVTICNVDIKNVGQGHRVRLLQWFHSMACIKMYKRRIWHFCASSHRFRDISTWNIWPWNSRLRSRSTTFVMALFDGKNKNLNFCARYHRFRDMNIWNICSRKRNSMPRSQSVTIVTVPFDANYQII